MAASDPADSGASELPEGALPQASLGRRLFALSLDWLASSLIARLLVSEQQLSGWITLLVFFAEVVLFTTLLGGSAGQVTLGIRVVDIDTGLRIGILAIIIRSALICLVVPPLLSVNGRGLHDRAVRSVTVLSA
jgi:uncharacterized RDD family membrane protein YckC